MENQVDLTMEIMKTLSLLKKCDHEYMYLVIDRLDAINELMRSETDSKKKGEYYEKQRMLQRIKVYYSRTYDELYKELVILEMKNDPEFITALRKIPMHYKRFSQKLKGGGFYFLEIMPTLTGCRTTNPDHVANNAVYSFKGIFGFSRWSKGDYEWSFGKLNNYLSDDYVVSEKEVKTLEELTKIYEREAAFIKALEEETKRKIEEKKLCFFSGKFEKINRYAE